MAFYITAPMSQNRVFIFKKYLVGKQHFSVRNPVIRVLFKLTICHRYCKVTKITIKICLNYSPDVSREEFLDLKK